MTDLALVFGTDLSIDASGDLLTSDGTEEGEERILRRLLTNAAEYIWNASYGAGIAQFLGQPMATVRIQAVIHAQMMQEAIVAQNPPPVVTVTGQKDGTCVVSIQYVDASTGQNAILGFNLTADSTVGSPATDFAIGAGRIGVDFLG